jgi:hypothetical protein
MNIFALSMDVIETSRWHLDKHIVKMPLETAQMMCTSLNKIGVETPYLPVHQKHPCTIWAGVSQQNFSWLGKLGLALCDEYTYRYGKVHKCESIIKFCLEKTFHFDDLGMTNFAQAMPDEYKCEDSILAYRNFYNFGKRHLHKWSKRPMPEWIVGY